MMEVPLIPLKHKKGENASPASISKSKDVKSCGASSEPSPNKLRINHNCTHNQSGHIVHPLSSGPVNCLIAVDRVLRATTDIGTPRQISLSPATSNWNCSEKERIYEPLVNTRHFFVKEYKKPLKWQNQGTKNYQILNTSGSCIYYAIEKSSFLSRLLFLRPICPFTLNIVTLTGQPVMEIQGRPGFKSCLSIRDPEHGLVGKLLKTGRTFSLCQSYSVRTYDDKEILRIKGPDGSNCCFLYDCICNCNSENDFDITLADGQTSVGKISSEWEYSIEDLCGVFVPMKLDENSMALLLGAVFYIDFGYYQRRRDVSCFGRCFLTFLFFALFVLLLFFIAKK